MSSTVNYGFGKPDVGGSDGAWGTTLNTTIDAIDTTVKAVSVVASAALPKSGGVLTGRVDVKTSTLARSDLGSIPAAQALDLAVAQYFSGQIDRNVSFTISNAATGTVAQGIILRLVNPGAFAITWPAGVKWPSGSAPAFTPTGTDVIVLLTDDNGVTWRAALVMKDVH